MVINFNMDSETRMHEMYKSMVGTPKPAENREALSPEDFWNTMKMVSLNKKAEIGYQNKQI